MIRIKFVWGGPERIKGRWYFGLFGFYGRTEGEHADGLAVSVRRLLPLLVTAGVAAWLAGAAALYWFWQRNPYNLQTYSDAVLLPLRRAQIRDQNGQALIAQGIDAFRDHKWEEASNYLKRGLALHPDDPRARLKLAEFYVASNQRGLALREYQEGLTVKFPGRAYLESMFGLAEQEENFDLVVQTARRYLPLLADEAGRLDRRWLSSREMGALLGARRFEDALAAAEAAEPGDLTREHRVLALLELHRTEDARRLLEEWRQLPGADRSTVVRLSVRVFREAGQMDEMERALRELKELSPTDPRPLVYGIIQQALAGRETAARAALDDFVFRFGGSPENLRLMAEPLAEIANLPLLEVCAASAAERGYAALPFNVLLVQALVQKSEWKAASAIFAKLVPPTGRDAPMHQAWAEWMKQLLDAVQGRSGTNAVTLVDVLRSRLWSVKIYQTTVAALLHAKQIETARDVTNLAQLRFPANASITKLAAEVALAVESQPSAPAAPVVVAQRFPKENVFFQRLGDALNGEKWDAAEQLLRDARNALPEPDWFALRDGDFRLAEVRVAHGKGERVRMQSVAGLFINGDPQRSRQALDLAQAIFNKGDKDSAIWIVAEVLRRTPTHTAARKLMAEWRPEPAVTK